MARLAAIVACALVAFASRAFPAPVVVYQRFVPVELRTGVVTVRVGVEAMLDVPGDCDGRPRSCLETRRFPLVYGLDFRLECREVDDGATTITAEDRGRIYVALDMEPDDERTFDDELHASISGLSADAFAEGFAAQDRDDPPFSSIAKWSVEPSWACFDGGNSRSLVGFSREVVPDGTMSEIASYTFTLGENEFVPAVCESMAEAVSTAAPEEIRTMPVPRGVLEHTLNAYVIDELVSEVHPDQLVPLPDGVTFTKRPESGSGQSSARSTSTSGTVLSMAMFTENGFKYTAEMHTAPLLPGAATGPAWLSRWTLETVERRLGPLPTTRVVDRESLVVALLPTLPAFETDADGEPLDRALEETYRIAFDQDAFFQEIAKRLDREAGLDAPTLERTITHRPSGLRSEGWILVVCRPDGSADFWIAPTQASVPIENAVLFCSAVESALK